MGYAHGAARILAVTAGNREPKNQHPFIDASFVTSLDSPVKNPATQFCVTGQSGSYALTRDGSPNSVKENAH